MIVISQFLQRDITSSLQTSGCVAKVGSNCRTKLLVILTVVALKQDIAENKNCFDKEGWP